jgi:hypothetical protein
MAIFDELCSLTNLELAWRRIGTGTSHAYKRFFRHLYDTYEIGLDQNLKDLQKRLKGGSYVPTQPTRVYIPKSSGLQRPITLLSLEDQIVWQAVANVFALKLQGRRKALELKSVFSNVLNRKVDTIFFTHRWHESYGQFQKKVEENFNNGYRWIAHFDLAAFYDTICHDLLMRVAVRGKGGDKFTHTALCWLEKWSSGHASGHHKHGIPQGPMASDFLAECFLLPIDEILSKQFNYVRYCDDIRMFARTESEARRAAIRLEVRCRERGLIPQGKKYTISEAKSVEDSMGSLPSIRPDSKDFDIFGFCYSAKKAASLFRVALGGKPLRIVDKTRVRHVLFNGQPSAKLLGYVLKLLPHHPEHLDAFAYYLSHYKRSKSVIRVCRAQARLSPYEYVRGEMWHILARMMKPSEMKPLVKLAKKAARDRAACTTLKWGVCHFLCKAEQAGLGSQSKYITRQKSPFLKSLLIPVLPASFYGPGHEVRDILKSGAYEPSMSLALEMVQRKLTCKTYGVKASVLPHQTRNVFRELGLVKGRGLAVDPMGEILARRYGISVWDRWKGLFGTEYGHALGLLASADPLYDSAKSSWLRFQNSFNDALFQAVQRLLHAKNLPGKATLRGRNGQPVKYGTLVSNGQPFASAYPVIAEALRGCNGRRNTLPESHPYDTKGHKTTILKKKEQSALHAKLASGYREILLLAKANL